MNHQRAFFLRANSRAISLNSSGEGGLGPSGGFTIYGRYTPKRKTEKVKTMKSSMIFKQMSP